MAQNHCEHFRPLRGGIVMVAATRRHFGTLGLIVTSTGADRWALTAGHVVAPSGGPVPPADPVFQPDMTVASFRIGDTTAARLDRTLDCAAFRIDATVPTSPEILGLGATAAPTRPVVGMRVVKSGRTSGVTEGVVERVTGSVVTIALHPTFPLAYELSEVGDSGAVWVDESTLAPVALHTAGSTSGPSVAAAVDIVDVLFSLGLTAIA